MVANKPTKDKLPGVERSVSVERECILLIDDNADSLDVMGKLLEVDGFRVITYTDPATACATLETEKYDFILTDLKMPEMDGLEILRRALQFDESACVILFTGNATLESAVSAINLGAYDYLTKPIDFDQLRISLNRARDRRRLELSRDRLLDTLEQSNKQLSRTLEELNALYDASESLSSTTDIRELLENILSLSSRVTGATMGSVMLVNDSGEYLTVAAAQGLSSELAQDVQQPMGESISGFVASSGEPLLIGNVEQDDRFRRQSRERYGNASLISVPLKVGSRILGVINLSRRSDGGVFTDADLRLLTMFASQAAVAIDDARQFEEKSRQLQEFKAIHELSERMVDVDSSEKMLELLFETLGKLIPVEYCIWLAYDPRAESLRVIGAVGREFAFSDTGKIIIDNTELKDPIVRGVTAESMTVNDKTALDKLAIEALDRIGFPEASQDTFMTAPVVRDGAVSYLFCIGAQYLDTFSAHDRSLTAIVVSQAAVLYEREKAVLNSSRLITMGNMISEISHDLRKPLTTIKGSVSLLRKASMSEDESHELLQMMEDEAHRLNELVTELVDFSKPHKYEAEKTDLRRLALRALELVAPDLEERGITSNISFDGSNWEVIINKNQIIEALLNLLMNAIDAMPDGGELTISGKLDRPDFKNQDYLAISISDTGMGIKKENLSKLFDRYFTTKTDGTGLGLAVVERVMSSHDGTVSVDSSEGHGTTITVYFPLEISEKRAANATNSHDATLAMPK